MKRHRDGEPVQCILGKTSIDKLVSTSPSLPDPRSAMENGRICAIIRYGTIQRKDRVLGKFTTVGQTTPRKRSI